MMIMPIDRWLQLLRTEDWPSSADLPDADDTPVDNELQNDIPNVLLNILRSIWHDRQDWFFGVDMGIYTEKSYSPTIVPDGFLAIGVPRQKTLTVGLVMSSGKKIGQYQF